MALVICGLIAMRCYEVDCERTGSGCALLAGPAGRPAGNAAVRSMWALALAGGVALRRVRLVGAQLAHHAAARAHLFVDADLARLRHASGIQAALRQRCR